MECDRRILSLSAGKTRNIRATTKEPGFMNDNLSQEQTATGTLALLRSTFAFGSMTTISRITGLVRDFVLARVVGA